MSSLFSGGRPFSPLVGQPGHVRRQSGSAGGSFIAESLGFNRTAPNASNQSHTSRSPQQRYQSSTTPLDSLSSSSNNTSGSSSAASTPQSSAAAAAMHRSNVMNQIAHAQAALSNLKQRTPASVNSATPSSHHSPMPYPHPGHPHSLTHTPSTLSSASSTPSSSQHSSGQPAPPTSQLKIKRKIRKNTREKQRRSELNDKFDSLQELLQLGGGQTKVEKYSVLSEAIQVIEMLRKENEELRSERKELRVELRKITSVLEHAFPAQPELAKEFTSKFFPHLSALSPHNVQQQQQLLGGGVGSSDFQFGGFGSGGSSIATTPSSAAGGAYGGSITSPTSYLLFHQQQQQGTAAQALLGGFAFNNASTGGAGAASAGGVKGQPGHRRGNSRNGSASSINFQSIYSQGMPGLGMIPPTPTTQSSLASLASINGQHARKQSLTLSGGGAQHKRQDSLNKAAIDELRINPYFLTNSASAAASTATPGQSMSISPTSTAAPASFPFQSVFPSSATTAASALPTASLSSFAHHNRQPSTDFKFSLSSLNSLQSLHNSANNAGTGAGGGGGLSPSPPAAGTSTFNFPSSIGLHGHNRSMSGNNFAVNFNVTIPGGDDVGAGGLLSGPYDSPSGTALFGGVGGGGGGGMGGGHGHHLSSGSLGGWVSGVVGGAATDGDMNDVASSDYQ